MTKPIAPSGLVTEKTSSKTNILEIVERIAETIPEADRVPCWKAIGLGRTS